MAIKESEERELIRRLRNAIKCCDYDLQNSIERQLEYIYRNCNDTVKTWVARIEEA